MSIQTIRAGKLEYLTAQGITVPHCFTTRLGGVSTGIFDALNIAIKEGESEENVRRNLEILAQALDFDPAYLVATRQTHSDIVRVVSRQDHVSLFHRDYPECDALITNDPGTVLMIYTADCTPLLFHDPVTGAVGAAHAGWKGTAQDIGGKTLAAMVENFGCDPADIRCAIGPNIGQCHFQTDEDVPRALLETYGPDVQAFIRTEGEKFYIDLKQVNALALRRRGVDRIEISPCCTVCEHDRFWSHRYTKGQRGSQGALILCKERKL